MYLSYKRPREIRLRFPLKWCRPCGCPTIEDTRVNTLESFRLSTDECGTVMHGSPHVHRSRSKFSKESYPTLIVKDNIKLHIKGVYEGWGCDLESEMQPCPTSILFYDARQTCLALLVLKITSTCHRAISLKRGVKRV